MSKEKSVRESIEEAMAENVVEVDEPVAEALEDVQDVEEAPEVEGAEAPETEIVDEFIDPPVSLKGEIKAKWKELPADVRAEWRRREDEIHRAMTAKDGDLNLGRTIKEIAAPYEAIIRSEGGTVEGTFKDLLNTSYILRAGTPQQKAMAIQQAIQQFGVDMGLVQQGSQRIDPNIAYLQQEIQSLRQMASPDAIKNQLQEQIERDRIAADINAFAANSANVHFQEVRSQMGALMKSGQAKNLQDAYEQACWANPSIRANLLKAQQAEEAAKRKAEMEKKKKAAASIQGSPDGSSPPQKTVKRSIEEEVREAMKAQQSSAI
jgi:hypothetical protein